MARDVRLAAIRVQQMMLSGEGSLSTLLPPALDSVAPADRALLQSLVYDLVRWATRLEGRVAALLDKPLKRKDADVQLTLQLGVLQLEERRMAPHAAVSTAVELTRQLGKPWASGLVNGVLRNYQRRRETLDRTLDESARFAHPAWWLSVLADDWPDDWQQILHANNQHAPMTLRVNTRRIAVDRWGAELPSGTLRPGHPAAPEALIVEPARPVAELPGFERGLVSVQDAAAQLAARILAAQAPRGARLLDACAAPGGKTAHALESHAWQQVVALDCDAKRLERVSQTLERLGLNERVQICHADAAVAADWWNGQPFEAVLLDAPCSGSGVVRRHPDIKLLRRRDDIARLAARQAALLDALWPLVAGHGCLLYATCSVFKAENEQVISAFLDRHDDVKLIDPLLGSGIPWGRRGPFGRQILPGDDDMDGFFYSLLVKRS